MPSRTYYSLPIPAASQTEEVGELSVNLAELSALGGIPSVEQVSQNPGDLRLTAQYRNPDAEAMATEVKELADSGGFDAVALYSESGSTPRDGYYSANTADIRPLQPQERQIQEVRATLTAVGTRETHWVGVETTPVAVTHSFGTDQTARVAVPATSTKRRWYNPEDGTVADVGTPLETRNADVGDLVIYDVDAGETAVGTGSLDVGPTLIYELDYSDEGVVDPVLWDDNGNAAKLDGNGERQWQHVFTTNHDYAGQPVLDSGLLRVYVDEAAGELTAEEWDDANTQWNAIAMDWASTDWEVLDWDTDTVTATTIRSRATFIHPTNGLYELDAALDRGMDRVRFDVPPNESTTIPANLETVLSPIASAEEVDMQPTRTLVERSDTQR